MIFLSAFASSARGQTAVQWRVEDGGNGHWYRAVYSDPNRTPEQWFSWAASNGGYAATVTSSGEQSVVVSLLIENPQVYNPVLGGKRNGSNVFQWITGEGWTFTAWSGGEPSCTCEKYLILYPTGWNDTNASLRPWAIIEYVADCNGDGIVDYGQILSGLLADGNGNLVPDCCEYSTPCARETRQWRVEDGGNGHWYSTTSAIANWDSTAAEAESRGGHLATLTSPEEGAFAAVFASSGPLLFGALQLPNSCEPSCGWQWVTGEPWLFEAWAQGEPNDQTGEEVAEVYVPNLWNDLPRRNSGRGLIEWSADCNADGIVDYGQILDGTFSDANANGVPDCCEGGPPCTPCDGDVTGNGTIDGIDLAIVLDAWDSSGKGEFPADVNGDGIVDGQDLAIVLSGWGPCPK